MYRDLTNGLSVHLDDYPEANLELIDKKLEEKMDLARTLVGLGRAARESVKIKVRQPIQKIYLDGKSEVILSDLKELIKEELNVKDVEFIEDVKAYMNYSLKPNFRALGPVLGKDMGLFGKALVNLNPAQVVKDFDAGKTVTVSLSNGREVEVNQEQLVVSISSKEGFTVEMLNNDFVILDTALTDELIQEGYAREFVSRIQQMRKSNDFDVSDHIKIYFESTPEFTEAIEKFKSYVMQETLADVMDSLGSQEAEVQQLNGHDAKVFLERIV
jgi:isoleucyl-tRNA synthetase